MRRGTFRAEWFPNSVRERPARSLLMFFSIIAGVSWGGAAEAAIEAAITRDRAVSPRVAGMLAAAVPEYSPPPPTEPAEAAPARPTASERLTPANGIVRLPEYVVR